MSQVDAFQGSVSTLFWLCIISVEFTENVSNKAFHHYSSFYLEYLLSLPPIYEIRVSHNITHRQVLAKCVLVDLCKSSRQAQQCKELLIFPCKHLIRYSRKIIFNCAAVLKCPDSGDNSFIRGRMWFHLLLSGWFTELEMFLFFRFSYQRSPHLLTKCIFLAFFSLLFKVNETVWKHGYSAKFQAHSKHSLLHREDDIFFFFRKSVFFHKAEFCHSPLTHSNEPRITGKKYIYIYKNQTKTQKNSGKNPVSLW